MRLPRIAFIDDGVSPELIPEGVLFEDYVADHRGVYAGAHASGETHGSVCYRIFRDRVHAPYHLVSIKALDERTGTGGIGPALSALRWCVDMGVDIVSMSMGTRQFADFKQIAGAVNCLQNTIVVAAANNSNTLTCPACLPSVIGVRNCGRGELRGAFAYIDEPYDQINVLTNAGNNLKPNSFSVPVVAARICDYFEQGHDSLDSVKRKLREDSLRNPSFVCYDFYKGLLPQWEPVSVPVVAITANPHDVAKKLSDLVSLYTKEGYRAVVLSHYLDTDVLNHVFQMKVAMFGGNIALQKLVELYYNFTLPDILFLHVDNAAAFSLPESGQADIVIGSECVSDTVFLNISDTVEELYARIHGITDGYA